MPDHAHHAIQITIGIDGDVRIRAAAGAWRPVRGVIVRADAPHAFDGDGVTGAMLFVDPESRHGRWLGSSLTEDVTVVPERRLEPCVRELRTFYERPLEGMEVGALVRHCVESLCAGPPPQRRLDDRVAGVLDRIRSATDLRLTLDEAARSVFLSPSRFAHLFTDHVGLPFRRYLLWRKLTRAMVEVSRGRTLATAAHAGGFSDSAHLTRTFYQMFGIPPSVMMKGEFFEVASPFETP